MVKPVLCWDTCVYISLLTGENRTPEEMKKLYEIEHMVNDGRAVVFTSTVTMVEVLACRLTPEQATKFKGLVGNPDTPFMPVDTRVAELAHDIRSFYDGKMSVPDAIHLATAIHFEAAAFHTYDGCSVRKRPGDLLRLAQPVAGKYKMPITVPEVPKTEEEAPPPLLVPAGLFSATGLPLPAITEAQKTEGIPSEKEEAAQKTERAE